MYKLISWYNQNRKKIWISILIIAFIFIIIRLFNIWSQQELEKEQKIAEENRKNNNNTISYANQSKSIVSGGKVDEVYQDKFGNIINSFLKNCTENNYEEAYELLSNDCKEELYPSLKMFIDQYCTEKFEEKKEYNFQSWTSEGNYIYLIKIYESMLSTGKSNTNYIQDYYTIRKELGEYKLNISGLVGIQKYQDKECKKDGIEIALKNTTVYMDNQLYDIEIQNNTENTILLDPREQTNKTYIIDSNGVKIEALLHENAEEDLKIEPQEKKKITIKFSNSYQSGTTIKKMVFSNIVLNEEEYQNRPEEYKGFKTIEVEL